MRNTFAPVVLASLMIGSIAVALPGEPNCPERLGVSQPAFTDRFAEYVSRHTFAGFDVMHQVRLATRARFISRGEAEWEAAYRTVGLEQPMRDRLAILRELSRRVYANAPPEIDGLSIVRWLAARLFVIREPSWRWPFLPRSRRLALSRTDLTAGSFAAGWSDFAALASELRDYSDRQVPTLGTISEDMDSVEELLSTVEDFRASALNGVGENDLTDPLVATFENAAEESVRLLDRMNLEQRLFGDVARTRRQGIHAELVGIMRRLVALVDEMPESDRWARYVASRLDASLVELDAALERAGKP